MIHTLQQSQLLHGPLYIILGTATLSATYCTLDWHIVNSTQYSGQPPDRHFTTHEIATWSTLHAQDCPTIHPERYSGLLHGPLYTILTIATWSTLYNTQYCQMVLCILWTFTWSILYYARYGQMFPSTLGHPHGPLCTMLGMAKWSTLYYARYGQMFPSTLGHPHGPLCTMLATAKLFCRSYTIRILRITLSACLFLCVLGSFFIFFFFCLFLCVLGSFFFLLFV